MNDVLKLTDIRRTYAQAGNELHVLNGVHLTLRAGEMVALVGPSGSGKTTLLQIVGLLDAPTSGTIQLGGKDVSVVNDRVRTQARRELLGFVYQFHHLLPDFTAEENIVLPQLIAGVARAGAEARAKELLAIMGLAARADHRPARLSGGEQQRVAIARALANKPKLLLADEPTGNLDPHTAEEVFTHLRQVTKQQGLAALVATHNMDLAARMDRTVHLVEGRLK